MSAKINSKAVSSEFFTTYFQGIQEFIVVRPHAALHAAHIARQSNARQKTE